MTDLDPAERSAARRFAAVVAAATLIGACLRVQNIRRESLWFDELLQFEWTRAPFGKFVADLFRNVEPPLNEILAWLWNHGLAAVAPGIAQDELAVRFPSLFLGVAAIPLLALAGRAAYGRFGGALGALLVAVNPYLVHYSQEARHYALLMVIVSTWLLLVVRVLRGDPPRRVVATMAILLAAAVYTHFCALLLLGAAFGASLLAWRRGRDPRIGALLRSELVAAAIVGPYLAAEAVVVALGSGHYTYLLSLGTPPLTAIPETGRRFVAFYFDRVMPHGSIDQIVLEGAIVALGLLVVAGAWGRRASEPPGLRLHLLTILVVPPIVLWSASWIRPVYQDRYVMYVIPAIVLLMARARPAWLAAALAVLPVAEGLGVIPRYRAHLRRDDFREAVETVAADCRAGDALAMGHGHDLVFNFYVLRRGEP